MFAGKGRVQGYVETHFEFFCTLYAQNATEAFPSCVVNGDATRSMVPL